jgi:hypothetical protein
MTSRRATMRRPGGAFGASRFAAVCLALAAVAVPRTGTAAPPVAANRLQQTIAIDPSTPITVDITEGTVEITGTDRHDLSIDIIRSATHGRDPSTLPMHVERTAAGVSITALQPDDGMDADLQTTVRIDAPADATFQAVRVFEGHIRLQNLHGAVTAEIIRGSIDAGDISGAVRCTGHLGDVTLTGARLTPGGVLRLRTFNGTVSLGLAETPANARVLAVTFRGTLTSTLPLQMKDKFGPRFGEATIGRGEPLISIDVVYGDIHITVPR